MRERVTVAKADGVSGDKRVCHYDELGEQAKQCFPSFVEAGEVAVDEEVGRELRECDLVKYTEYYEIRQV